jgi:hypothetical protein
MTQGQQEISLGNGLPKLVSSKCLKRRSFYSNSKPYREFESTPLRHAVWIAEKTCLFSLEDPQKCRNSGIFGLKPDRRNWPADQEVPRCQPFSPPAQ